MLGKTGEVGYEVLGPLEEKGEKEGKRERERGKVNDLILQIVYPLLSTPH
jgi:hypothetical protein